MRLIDADALIEEMEKEIYHYWNEGGGGYYLAEDAIEEVKLAPTVEAEPVRHGKIIETIKGGKHHREFSCCGRDFTQLTMWYMPRFCPNCGAKMDGDK